MNRLAFVALLVLGACAVQRAGTDEFVSYEYDPGFESKESLQAKGTKYCAQFGRRAEVFSMGPVADYLPSALTRQTATVKCLPPGPSATAPAAPAAPRPLQVPQTPAS
ncbi:hypothetical protein QFZ27_000233 [Inquilinus ginsengisoli]|uniref:hypothetical protein n=1 Tax=Inquilinus ginsengisoli TaxID=363840 RepID=UPI003D1DC051